MTTSKDSERNRRKKELAKQRKVEEQELASKLNTQIVADFSKVTMSAPIFEVKSASGKKLGVFALRLIKSGTDILREDAILKGCTHWLCKEALFMVLPEHKKKSFLALHSNGCACGEEPCLETPARKIFETNSYDVCHDDTLKRGVEDIAPAIYLTASRINHSCTPNTACGFTEEDHIIFRAKRDISAGEEITANYSGVYGSTSFRREFLLSNCKFHCLCTACVGNLTTPKEQLRIKANDVKVTTSSIKILGKSTPEEIAKVHEVAEWSNTMLSYWEKSQKGLVQRLQLQTLTGATEEELMDTVAQMLQFYKELLAEENKYGVSQEAIENHIRVQQPAFEKHFEDHIDTLNAGIAAIIADSGS
ncbi:uncharacterized protein PAC_03371 [Phialocephala subalpina]|uniref:SET domain-containing protein n=1 Tax=Phialocephala subalpina TaxID=576137 RepID=A0A1L7WL41_9HELO|nr:uncharacterized protein PAC_03371 [Phialocephala subalpina]